MESKKKTLKKKALKNEKENMQESNIYTIMHCRLARLYLSGNDVLSLPDDTEILVNVCRVYTRSLRIPLLRCMQWKKTGKTADMRNMSIVTTAAKKSLTGWKNKTKQNECS